VKHGVGSPLICIRDERRGDEFAISSVVQRAYADVAYSDHREHQMVDRLRLGNPSHTAVSLLAEAQSHAVGHVLLTHAVIRDGPKSVPTLALAPLSVVPELQDRGVGSALVRAACAKATALGHSSVLVVGIPRFYDRFGFKPLSCYPITIPFAAPAAICWMMELKPGALDDVRGQVQYAPGWLDH
jgi:predicted N-acetyltransferase YhbS